MSERSVNKKGVNRDSSRLNRISYENPLSFVNHVDVQQKAWYSTVTLARCRHWSHPEAQEGARQGPLPSITANPG